MNEIIEENIHPTYSIKDIVKLVRNRSDLNKKKAYYSFLIRIPSFQRIHESLNKDGCVIKKTPEKLPVSLNTWISHWTKKSKLDVDPVEETIEKMSCNNNDVTKNHIENSIDGTESETSDSDSDSSIDKTVSSIQNNYMEAKIQKDLQSIQYSEIAFRRSINFADSHNKKIHIVNEVNKLKNLSFIATSPIFFESYYQKFNIRGKISYVDEVKKSTIVTRRVKKYTGLKIADKLIAQCYMELTNCQNCYVAYSYKNNQRPMDVFEVKRDTCFFNLEVFNALVEITNNIRRLTIQNFTELYKKHNIKQNVTQHCSKLMLK